MLMQYFLWIRLFTCIVLNNFAQGSCSLVKEYLSGCPLVEQFIAENLNSAKLSNRCIHVNIFI